MVYFHKLKVANNKNIKSISFIKLFEFLSLEENIVELHKYNVALWEPLNSGYGAKFEFHMNTSLEMLLGFLCEFGGEGREWYGKK